MRTVNARSRPGHSTDSSADLVLSEYGSAIWSDPYLWIPEASRLLRPGGLLIFLRNSTLAILCSPDGDEPGDDAPVVCHVDLLTARSELAQHLARTLLQLSHPDCSHALLRIDIDTNVDTIIAGPGVARQLALYWPRRLATGVSSRLHFNIKKGTESDR